MKKHIILKIKPILLTVFLLLFSFPALAAKDFLTQYKKELDAVEHYLNNIKNLSSRFVQETIDGKVEGKFYLSRPGKMRIEYLAQPKIIITVNGSVLSYLDVELDEVSHISTNTTPASFLTRENISFSAKDVEITNVDNSSNEFRVSLMKKNRKDAGEFTLVFKKDPLVFARMEVKNDLNQVIRVSLVNTDFNSAIPDNIFIIKNKILP